MRRLFASSAGVCAIAIASQVADAQHAADAERLVAQARAATARYQNADAAVADGFKRVGVEFPAMGEHWVSLSRVLENRFDATRPTVLIYITNHGKRQLAGVGYTALLGDKDRPPKTAAKLSDWHEHNGSVIDESLPGHGGAAHGGLPAEATAMGATRLAILHVWAWTKNPAGAFVTDNWNIPLIRAGTPARSLGLAAVRGLSLAEDSASYYEQTLNTALAATDADAERIHVIVGDARGRARTAAQRRGGLGDEAALAAAWSSLWDGLARTFPSRAAELRAIRAKL